MTKKKLTAEEQAAVEAVAMQEYNDAYWRTVAYNEGLELSADISVEGPHVDFAGGLIPNPETPASRKKKK